MDYDSTMERDELPIHAASWMNLRIIILSEKS